MEEVAEVGKGVRAKRKGMGREGCEDGMEEDEKGRWRCGGCGG
jgi:hypothetical protein